MVPVAPIAQVTLIAPIEPIQNAQFDKLKVAMDAQVAQIAGLIAHKDKQSVKTTKQLCPLADEVTFTKFDEDGSPRDHITIFKIERGAIATNEKLKLQQFPAFFSGNALR